MKNYTYQNSLISKTQLRQLLAWSFTNYDSMQACSLADDLKHLGFQYATKAGISISIEDLKIPFVKDLMLEKANQDILNTEKIYLRGKITEVERFQKLIDTWSLTSEALKEQIVYYFKNYDPLNSVYIMAFSGARGNLSQVRQLVGMRGLMSDPSGQIMNLPIKKNFREGLTITDYLMSGYGARKGIVDTALKTANSGYLTRRLIDVAQDILIREKDCSTNHTFLFTLPQNNQNTVLNSINEKLTGRCLSKAVYEKRTNILIANKNTHITDHLVKQFLDKNIPQVFIRSPLNCKLYRAICQNCYGWDLANENLIDLGEAIGILAGQSIGEPGTQLTMRTFHTGGIFTSEAREQITSPINGIIKFYKGLKTALIRTNRGEDVLVTKSFGGAIIIPTRKTDLLTYINISRNTILFPKNNQYILKDSVIGEIINTKKSIKNEVKPILSDKCGEVFIPRLKQKINVVNNNKLIWILDGQLYNSPINSFLNFYPDYKLNPYSYIFRTKLINHYTGIVKYRNNYSGLQERILKINNKKYCFQSSQLKILKQYSRTSLLTVQNYNYFVKVKKQNFQNYILLAKNQKLATLITNAYKTPVGGQLFYDSRIIQDLKSYFNELICIEPSQRIVNYQSNAIYRTVIWLSEEFHTMNCEFNSLTFDHGDFILKGFELMPGLTSKISGYVNILQKSNSIQSLTIKSGIIYEGRNLKQFHQKVYYPGEIIFTNILANNLVLCEQISKKKSDQLLVRPILVYEFPHTPMGPKKFTYKKSEFNSSRVDLKLRSSYSYRSNQLLKGTVSHNLITNFLTLDLDQLLKQNIQLELKLDKILNSVYLNVIENISFSKHLLPDLRYSSIQPCLLVQENQFLSPYCVFSYLEDVTENSLEIIKFKIKKQLIKQVFLISNHDCVIVKKEGISNKKINDFIISKRDFDKTGRIIVKNKGYYTIQRGQPYFFPNCKSMNKLARTNLEYKILPPLQINGKFTTKRNIALNYNNITKSTVKLKRKSNSLKNSTKEMSIKYEFSKLFLKNNGKFYTSLVPRFFKKFSIKTTQVPSKINSFLSPLENKKQNKQKLHRVILVQSSDIIINKVKLNLLSSINYQLLLLKYVEQPFNKVNKSTGLYSITEDYFEQDLNNLFCTNNEFLDAGKTIGFLNLEKEITGDIVQGLPRIEEILEARKKNLLLKRVPTSTKVGLLIQKTGLDHQFEFARLGSPIKENDKINPYKLLKTYFNYYGLIKYFSCDKTCQFTSAQLLENYEGIYKSFKKVQLFILHAVQNVYYSQGVRINDKHLEVIIKQMTTKVLVTYEGNTPLLRREVIDLYHIKYINEIIKTERKQVAYYVPLLLGITKAALNNPSFISAASFQETTRVLTKAAIEGRIDWLRGLKENIIIGHLIPAGTGSQNYKSCFRNIINNSKPFTSVRNNL